jgi:hypothetical protein
MHKAAFLSGEVAKRQPSKKEYPGNLANASTQKKLGAVRTSTGEIG